MTKRPFGELKRLAREYLTGNYPIAILIMMISYLLPAAVLSPFTPDLSWKFDSAAVTYILAAVIVKIFGQLLTTGVIRIHLLLAKKQPVTPADLFWTFRSNPDRFILGTLLLFSMELVPAVPAAACIIYAAEQRSVSAYVLLGLAAAVGAAAEIFLSCMYSLIYPLYIDNLEMPVLEAFRTSRTLMRGNKMRLFLLKLSFLGWIFLGIGSLGIGLLWISPYMTQTSVNFYLDLTGQLDRISFHIDAAA